VTLSSRVMLRGGAWSLHPVNCRSASRNLNHPSDAFHDLGFRVCCLPDKSPPHHVVMRGGLWLNDPWYCRSAGRFGPLADIRPYSIGFRVCCLAPKSGEVK